MNFYLNRIVWITGASKGIGRALAVELKNRGAILALTSRNYEELAALRRELGGVKCGIYAGDVSDVAAMRAVATQIETELGPIDILVANAGTHLLTDPLKFDATEYLSLMNVNYGGLVNCMEAVFPSMLKRKKGQIVGLSSMAGYRGMPTAAAYGASKAAIATFLEGARFHLNEAGIVTTIVYPGFVKTPLTDKNTFHMPFLMQPDRAARIMANGIAKQRKSITFPWPFNWIMNFTRIIPFSLYEIILGKVWKKAFPR